MENENFNTDQQPDEIIKPQQEEQSSPKQEQYVWHQDDYAANLNKQPAEGASFREEEPVQPYFPGTDSKTYKQNIKSMKQEYKAIKREEKKAKRESRNRQPLYFLYSSYFCNLYFNYRKCCFYIYQCIPYSRQQYSGKICPFPYKRHRQ